MKKTINLLLILLVVQIVLSAWLFSKGSGLETFSTEEKLLGGLSIAELDEVELSDKDSKITLRSSADSKWILPEKDNFPVDPIKLRQINEKALDLNKSYPVAVTSAAAKQFKVSKDDFERKLVFKKDGKDKAILYLGTSPGFKKVHARVEGENNIYSVDSNVFNFPVKSEDWIDKSILSVPLEEFEKLDIKGIEILSPKAKEFELAGLQESEKANMSEIKNIVYKVVKMQVKSLLGKDVDTSQDEQVLTFKVFTRDGKSFTNDVYKSDKSEDYIVKSTKSPYYFEVGSTFINPLKDLSRANLLDGDKESEEVTENEEDDLNDDVLEQVLGEIADSAGDTN